MNEVDLLCESYEAGRICKPGDALHPVKLDKLWFPTWMIAPVKLDEAEYSVKLYEAVYPLMLCEL